MILTFLVRDTEICISPVLKTFFYPSTSSIPRSAWTVSYETRWTRKHKLGGWAVGQARPPQILESCLLLYQQLFAEALLSDSHVLPRETASALMIRECHCSWMWHSSREYLWARRWVSSLYVKTMNGAFSKVLERVAFRGSQYVSPYTPKHKQQQQQQNTWAWEN